MMWALLSLGVVAVLALGLVGYAGSRMGQPPPGSPAEVLAQGAPPTDRPVLVCLGDSITQARNGGRCRANDLCLGKCKEDENSNIPGGHGGCSFVAFDPSKAKLIGDAQGTQD